MVNPRAVMQICLFDWRNNMLIGYLTNTALEVGPDGKYPPFSAEAWSFAGQITLLGMLMVFAALALLWGILAIFKAIFAGKTPSEKKPEVEKTTPVQETPSPVADEQSGDEELVAVITAAVAAYMSDEGDPAANGGFRVVSFKRVREGRSWNSK